MPTRGFRLHAEEHDRDTLRHRDTESRCLFHVRGYEARSISQILLCCSGVRARGKFKGVFANDMSEKSGLPSGARGAGAKTVDHSALTVADDRSVGEPHQENVGGYIRRRLMVCFMIDAQYPVS